MRLRTNDQNSGCGTGIVPTILLAFGLAMVLALSATVALGQTPTPTPTATPTPTPTPLPFGAAPGTSPEGSGSGARPVTTFASAIRFGNTTDNSGKFPAIGVPSNSIPVQFGLEKPPASDDDYFAVAQVANTVGATLTLVQTTAPVNTSTGAPYAFCLVLTPSTTVTAGVTVRFRDAQLQVRSVDAAWAASSTAVTMTAACRELISITVTDGFGASETIKVGFGDTIGLPYPAYNSWGSAVFYDEYSDDFPATAMTVTTDYVLTPGDPTSTTADWYGTVLLQNSKDPNGTRSYVIGYNASLVWRSSATSFSAYPNSSSILFR